ncbi:MAG: TlpA family protein disulfide reductase [Flammeovirgaceae bacterium]
MAKEALSWIKALASAVLVIVVLKYTGLLSYVTQATQLVAIETGLLDASTDVKEKEVFNYDFTVKNLNGETLNFDQYQGKVVFLNLWATWCGPCKVEMPAIQKLYESVGSDSIAFVMLSIDRERDQHKVSKYIKDKGFTFPVFVKSGDLTSQLNVPAIPTTFIIGKNGKIASKEVGTTNFNTPKFKKFLKDLSK